MAQRRSNKVKPFPLTIGNDPSLYRYASVQDALAANVDLIAQTIRAGEEAAVQEEVALSDAVEHSESEAAAR